MIAEPSRVRLSLVGDVDIATAPRLVTTIDRLIREGNRRIEIDFEGVGFIDSSALAALVSARRRLNGDGELVLTGVSRSLRKIFEVTGLERYFDLA